MAWIVTKLAKKLPRIVAPATLPNGGAARWSLDPYLENDAAWATSSANALRNLGRQDTASKAGIYFINQSLPTGINQRLKYYIEIEKIVGALDVYPISFAPAVLSEPGAYILEEPNTSTNGIGLAFDNSFFNPDPFFKKVAVGNLSITQPAEGFYGSGAVNAASKNADGRININPAGANYYILYHSSWIGASGRTIRATFTVDYVPPTVLLKVFGGGSLQASGISAPGKYTVVFVDSGGSDIGIGIESSNTSANCPPVIVSKIEIQDVNQTWTVEGDLFVQVTALWGALAADFDAIVNPQYQVSSSQHSRYNLTSAIQPNFAQLGYCGYVPPAGMYRVGDTIYNPSGSPSGWRCVQAGNPGLWAPLPTL